LFLISAAFVISLDIFYVPPEIEIELRKKMRLRISADRGGECPIANLLADGLSAFVRHYACLKICAAVYMDAPSSSHRALDLCHVRD
jgi:hypothetical protein